MEEIKDLYKMLLKKKYQKALKSIPEFKRIRLLEYAQNVHAHAWIRINNLRDSEAPYNWPYSRNDDKTEDKLQDYLTTSTVIISLLEDKQPDDRIEEQALIAFYNDEKIPRGKGNPSKFYIRFGYYKHQYNRIGPEDSPVKNKNKVELFNKVISKLSGEAKIKAEKDLSELSKNIIGHVYFEKDLKTLNI